MDKYTKAVLTVIALSVIPLSAEADKILYCEMEEFVHLQKNKMDQYALEKFKIKVTESNIQFGRSGFFRNMTLKMHTYVSGSYWWAIEDATVSSFKDGYYFFAQAMPDSSIAISARCDDF